MGQALEMQALEMSRFLSHQWWGGCETTLLCLTVLDAAFDQDSYFPFNFNYKVSMRVFESGDSGDCDFHEFDGMDRELAEHLTSLDAK